MSKNKTGFLDWISEHIFWIIVFFAIFGPALGKFILKFTATIKGTPVVIEQVQEPKDEKKEATVKDEKKEDDAFGQSTDNF